MKAGSRLEKVLTAGKFAVTAELGPPQNANPEAVKKKSKHCVDVVDGANVTVTSWLSPGFTSKLVTSTV